MNNIQEERPWTFRSSTFCREIRRVNRNRLILAGLVLAVILSLDTFQTINKLYHALHKPEAVTHAELSAIRDPLTQLTQKRFSANLEVSEEFSSDAIKKRLMLEKNGTVRLSFTPLSLETVPDIGAAEGEESFVIYALAALEDGQCILVKHASMADTAALTGTVGYLPLDARQIVLEKSGVTPAALLPLILDATEETFDSVGTDAAFSGFLLLLWGVWLFFILRRARSIERDPAYKQLFVYAGSVEDNARQIDEELAGSSVYRAGSVTVTENWRIRRRLFSFSVECRPSDA